MNKFEYLIFDLCLAYCNLCRNSSIHNEIYLGNADILIVSLVTINFSELKRMVSLLFFMDVLPVQTTASIQERVYNVFV